ncbi:class I SAM-dependent methyltransferase [Streptomyces sp. BI20]|uniref:class I SAM-dependent methyltransferase n=1 Tax=Streptomyces sp. BI20 TaxID=3403460 RepID=UPI003C7101D1
MTIDASGRARARSFDAAAALYAAHRPSYPPALLDAVEELAGRPLADSLAVDVGAGTGLATALLYERGARVLAVEPGDGMAEQFRRDLPHLPVVRGVGEHLPLADRSVDLVTYAQAFHWTDPARSVPEARRVLRPGGALALWWNDWDTDTDWLAAQDRRIRGFFDAIGVSLRDVPVDPPFVARRVTWSRRLTLDAHLANHASHSAFLLLGAAGTHEFLARERDRLAALFPEGVVEERYVTSLFVARP